MTKIDQNVFKNGIFGKNPFSLDSSKRHLNSFQKSENLNMEQINVNFKELFPVMK